MGKNRKKVITLDDIAEKLDKLIKDIRMRVELMERKLNKKI